MSINNQVSSDRRIIGINVRGNPSFDKPIPRFDVFSQSMVWGSTENVQNNSHLLQAPGSLLDSSGIDVVPRAIVAHNILSANYLEGGIIIPKDGRIRGYHANIIENFRGGEVTLGMIHNGVIANNSISIPNNASGTYNQTNQFFTVREGDYVSFTVYDAAVGASGSFKMGVPTTEIEYF